MPRPHFCPHGNHQVVGEAPKKTFCGFLDVRTAHPTVLRADLMEKLHSKLSKASGGDAQCRCHLWSVIDKLYENYPSRIVIQDSVSDEYKVNHGLREGSVLSPILYAIFIDGIIDEMRGCIGANVGSFSYNALIYVYDIVLVSESAEDLQAMLNCCQKYADNPSFQFPCQSLKLSYSERTRISSFSGN
jgi:hypothetical protein